MHSHKLFRCRSLAAPSLQKVIGTSFHTSPQRIFTVVLCPKGWSRETWACDLQNPGAPREFCSSFTLRQDLPPGLNPNTSHCYPLGHTAFSYHFPHPFPWACENKEAHVWQLLHTESLGAIVESSDGNDLPKGSVPLFCRGPSPTAFSVTDCGELGRKQLLLFKSYVLTKPKLWWTENKQAQFMKKYTDRSSSLVSLHWLQGKLQQHWWWTHPSRAKQGFLQILLYLLQSAVLSVSIQSAISSTIKPDVRRHGPSTGTESMPFRKCRIKIKNPKKAEICWCLELSVS